MQQTNRVKLGDYADRFQFVNKNHLQILSSFKK